MPSKRVARGQAQPARQPMDEVEGIPADLNLPTCLVCLATVELASEQRQTAAEHTHSHDPKMIVPCRGSGYIVEQHDGRDGVRREALNKRRDVLIDVNEKRAEFGRDLITNRWDLAGLVGFSAEAIIRRESTADVWLFLTESGNWWATLQKVLSDLNGSLPGNSLDGAIDHLKDRGRRDWIIENRRRLVTLADKRGEPTLSGLLEVI